MNTQEAYQRELREREVRQKRLDAIVQAATDDVARAVADEQPALHLQTFFGASAVHPRHLAIWFVFKTDADYAQAQTSGLVNRIDALTRDALERHGHPAAVIEEIPVRFATHETIPASCVPRLIASRPSGEMIESYRSLLEQV